MLFLDDVIGAKSILADVSTCHGGSDGAATGRISLSAGLPGCAVFMRLHKSRIGKFFLLPAGRTLYLVFDVTQNAMKGHVSDDRAMLFPISNEETGCRQEFAIASHVYKCIMHLAEADPLDTDLP